MIQTYQIYNRGKLAIFIDGVGEFSPGITDIGLTEEQLENVLQNQKLSIVAEKENGNSD